MLSEAAADAVLRRWGSIENLEALGYPSQSFYCSDHAAGYRDSPALIEPDDERMEWALRRLRRRNRESFARLRSYYVDGVKSDQVRRDRLLFCDEWDAWRPWLL